MIRLWKNRAAHFGHLEAEVMEIIWRHGASTVSDVAGKLDRPLAYTTVMTTLDRLFKKGLLKRQKSERAFVYSERISRRAWDKKQTGDFVAAFLTGPESSGQLLISCLVEAAADQALLDQLEETIRKKRRELAQRGKS